MRFRVLIEADEDGVFIATCPSLPGCVSQGNTRDEALSNIRDAMAAYVASLEKHGEAIPPSVKSIRALAGVSFKPRKSVPGGSAWKSRPSTSGTSVKLP